MDPDELDGLVEHITGLPEGLPHLREDLIDRLRRHKTCFRMRPWWRVLEYKMKLP